MKPLDGGHGLPEPPMPLADTTMIPQGGGGTKLEASAWPPPDEDPSSSMGALPLPRTASAKEVGEVLEKWLAVGDLPSEDVG
jgi:hypothetical protein